MKKYIEECHFNGGWDTTNETHEGYNTVEEAVADHQLILDDYSGQILNGEMDEEDAWDIREFRLRNTETSGIHYFRLSDGGQVFATAQTFERKPSLSLDI